jgi:hypothetical protein
MASGDRTHVGLGKFRWSVYPPGQDSCSIGHRQGMANLLTVDQPAIRTGQLQDTTQI